MSKRAMASCFLFAVFLVAGCRGGVDPKTTADKATPTTSDVSAPRPTDHGARPNRAAKTGSAELNCENINKRNAQCQDEIVNAKVRKVIHKVPKEMQKVLISKMRKEIQGEDFLKTCRIAWVSTSYKDVSQKRALEKCFHKSSCLDYGECVADEL